MENSLYISPSVLEQHKDKEMWRTPIRSSVRTLRREGKSYSQIVVLIGLKRSTIQGIVKGPSSCTTRAGKATKKPALKTADIKHIFRFVSASWANRIKS